MGHEGAAQSAGRRPDSYRFILPEKADFEVRLMCEVLGVARSAYYEWEGERRAQKTRL